MTQAVGIDLGTTNSAVARIVGKKSVVLTNSVGDSTIPSAVKFDKSGNAVTVGQKALDARTQDPHLVVESVKRRMGEEEPVARIGNNEFLAEEVSAMILEKLKEIAENQLGSPVTNAVITVPAYFSDNERTATKRAGQIAGLTVDRIINEPTAAMLYRGIRRNDNITALVYDLGGGTFDVSIVTASDGVFEVIATDGLSHHGGDDWDARLAGQIKRIIEQDTGQSIDEDGQTMQRIWKAACDAKHELSHRETTVVELPFVFSNPEYHFSKELTRKEFADITNNLLEETVQKCHEVIDEANLTAEQIDEVLLVGGATRMPQIERRLRECFGQNVTSSSTPDEVVAKGAAIQAGILQNSLPVLGEDSSPSLRQRERRALETNGDTKALDKMDEPTYDLPQVYDDIVLVDVTSRSLGVRVKGDNFSKIIRRNTPIPTERTERYVTVDDEQTNIRVTVFQGESMTASENERLDEFVFSGLPPLPAGEAKIDTTFHIDNNGILNVTVESVQKGHSDSIQIESGVGFGQREIEEMQSNLPEVR